MKKILNSLAFFSKVFVLILLLVFGWVFINVTNLIKGKKTTDGNSEDKNIWGPDWANADTVGGPNPAPSCPHIAYFDGKEFRIENDLLSGEFKNTRPDFPFFSRWAESETEGLPDLLKFSSVPQTKENTLVLRLEEIEPEESFIKKIKLIRLLHLESSEILIDAVWRKPIAVYREQIENAAILPHKAILNRDSDVTSLFQNKSRPWASPTVSRDNLFEQGDSVEFKFQGLKSGSETILIIQAAFRDWFAGETASNNPLKSLITARALISTTAFLLGIIFLSFKQKDAAYLLTSLPLVFGIQAKSIRFSYLASSGRFMPLAIQKPRAFRHTTEYVNIPKEAVREDGAMTIRADFTKRHQLNFAAAAQSIQSILFRKETLPIKRAIHSRRGEVTELVQENGTGTHMIPGDTIDLEFVQPRLKRNANEKETYLMESYGYYTKLRPEYKKLAGNWQDKLSPEAKKHYQTLADLGRR